MIGKITQWAILRLLPLGKSPLMISPIWQNTIRAGINDQVHDVGSNYLYIYSILIYQELENLRIEI